MDNSISVSAILIIKSGHALMLFEHFAAEFRKIGPVEIRPHKTMVTLANTDRRIAYLTQAGKKFITVVFAFKRSYNDTLCFHRIQQVAGRHAIYHHLQIHNAEDINDEVRKFMKMAYTGE